MFLCVMVSLGVMMHFWFCFAGFSSFSPAAGKNVCEITKLNNSRISQSAAGYFSSSAWTFLRSEKLLQNYRSYADTCFLQLAAFLFSPLLKICCIIGILSSVPLIFGGQHCFLGGTITLHSNRHAVSYGGCVWPSRRNIIRTVLCFLLYNSCAQSYACTSV